MGNLPCVRDKEKAAAALFRSAHCAADAAAVTVMKSHTWSNTRMPYQHVRGTPSPTPTWRACHCCALQALHFIQIIRSGRFQLFDYGSAAANSARYGTPRPPDIGAQYWRLAGLHIDLLAGQRHILLFHGHLALSNDVALVFHCCGCSWLCRC